MKPESQNINEILHVDRVYNGIYDILEKEFVEISRFIAFTEDNFDTYSIKIQELHLRICSEIENILKLVIHKHFVSEEEILTLWETQKSSFLNQKSLTDDYSDLYNKLNSNEKTKLDKYLFGFPDFAFYFKIACNKFNLDKKGAIFLLGITPTTTLHILQPFEIENGLNVPTWWTNYNKIKHDKLNNFSRCKLSDLINSMSGVYLLMNYLTKYWTDNIPTFDSDYFTKHPAGNYHGCEFWSFDSKVFKPTVSMQSMQFSNQMPSYLSNEDFDSRYKDVKFDEIIDKSYCEDKYLLKFSNKENCLFHLYFGYFQYYNFPTQTTIWKKEYFGKFSN